VGGAELLILLAIVLLVFGAKRVPQLGRSLGEGFRDFRKGLADAADDDDAGELRARENEDGEEPSPGEAAPGVASHAEGEGNAPSGRSRRAGDNENVWEKMFGIGFQELLIIVFLALIVLGPGRLPQMARELGHFVSEARSSLDDFRDELSFEEEEEADEVQLELEESREERAPSKRQDTQHQEL
jgi:Tat protein translocase TatB subunit